MFLDYVLHAHTEDVLNILQDSGIFNNFSVNIDFLKLFEADPNLGDGVLCNPKHTIAKCDEALAEAQKKVLENQPLTTQKILTIKRNVHARFFGLPVCPELHRVSIPKNNDLGCFLKVTGTAIRMTQCKMLEYRRSYKCMKCHHIQVVKGKYEFRYVIKPPTACTNPDIQCRSSTMTPINTITRENCKDYQEMKIQEQVNKLTVGRIPGSIWVTLEDDLVDCCKPGDDVSICGTILRRWSPVGMNKKCEVELVLKANHIEVINAQKAIAVAMAPDVKQDFDKFWTDHRKYPMKGRDVILASVCPQVYGMYMVKMALTLTVITGSGHNLDADYHVSSKSSPPCDEGKSHSVRGQCHLLLVGDPGTGKSQLLKAGALLTTRSILTSGSGSTKAGLTCTALREDGEWQLEAGALVLADGGACCIDELAQMREHDRAAIHEAMEQQTISVAKAGIICKLNTRCAVIAACNPKGHYDTEQALSVNVSLGTPLLSRFDLIFILLDTQNAKWDKLVSDYILFGKITGAPFLKTWTLEKVQLYMSLIGPFEVQMTQKATDILQAYYVKQRRAEHRDPSRTTVRMLDSLVRLSQAHARLMYRKQVLPMDAIAAVSLMDLSMQDCTLSDTSDALHSTFTKYPDFEYLLTAKQVLTSLNLCDIWQGEVEYYCKLLEIDKHVLQDDIEKGNTRHFTESCHNDTRIVQTQIVESVYFAGKSNENDGNSQRESSQFQCNLENEDYDKFLDLNDTFVNPSNGKNKVTKKNDESELNVTEIVENEIDKIEMNENRKSVTEELLAKTIKKHSNLNFGRKVSDGVITGKRKRIQNGNAKSKRIKKAPDSLQNVLDELNDGKCAKNKRKPEMNKEKKRRIGNKNRKSESNGCDALNETALLKFVPSVNDVFNDIDLDLSNDSCGNVSLFDDSENIENNSDVIVNVSPVVNEIKNNKMTVLNESESKKPSMKVNESCVSPNVEKTKQKLSNFSFSSSKKKQNTDENTLLRSSQRNSSVAAVSIDRASTVILSEYERNSVQAEPDIPREILASSQLSLFENEDEDYDVLNI